MRKVVAQDHITKMDGMSSHRCKNGGNKVLLSLLLPSDAMVSTFSVAFHEWKTPLLNCKEDTQVVFHFCIF